jgi:hypothetical protein
LRGTLPLVLWSHAVRGHPVVLVAALRR